MAEALFDLDDIAPEWTPVYSLARCRDCGARAGANQGGAGAEGVWIVCDACAEVDRCTTRAESTPDRHVSHWGDWHAGTDHDRLTAARERRRAAYRAAAS